MNRIANSILAVVCLLAFQPVMAQETPMTPEGETRKSSIEGFWQLCTFQKDDKGEVALHLAPVLKCFSADGAYTTLITKTTAGGSLISETGRVEKLNDSVLVLTPRSMRHNELQSKPDTVTFHLQGAQWIVIDCKEDGEATSNHEIWMRLRSNPAARNMIEAMKKGNDINEMPQMPMRHGKGGKGNGMKQRMPMRNNDALDGMEFNNGMNTGGGSNNWMDED